MTAAELLAELLASAFPDRAFTPEEAPGHDHKYVYTHLGYNLKLTDMQAAIGVAQLRKLASFVEARRRNWTFLREALAGLEEYFLLPRPAEHADPSWFGVDPGLTAPMMEWIAESFHRFAASGHRASIGAVL